MQSQGYEFTFVCQALTLAGRVHSVVHLPAHFAICVYQLCVNSKKALQERETAYKQEHPRSSGLLLALAFGWRLD